jgi:hypothetical protein
MKFCAAAGCETDSVSRSAGRLATIPVMRHSYQYRQAVQSAPGTSLSGAPAMTLAAGTQLGSYLIVGPLGAGGMGEVYRA